MEEVRVMTEFQLKHIRQKISWKTVKEIKKMCPAYGISSVWYNKAIKQELIKHLVWKMDSQGVKDGFLESHLRWPGFKWEDLPIKAPGHIQQYFVENPADLTEPGPPWRSYKPLTAEAKTDRHGGHYHAETLLNSYTTEDREWTGDPDPLGLCGGQVADPVEPVEPEPVEPDPLTATAVQILTGTVGSGVNQQMWNTLNQQAIASVSSDPLLQPEPKPEPTKEPQMEPLQIPASAQSQGGTLDGMMSQLMIQAMGGKIEEALKNIGISHEAMVELVNKVVMDKAVLNFEPVIAPEPNTKQLHLVHEKFEAAKFWLQHGFAVYLNGPAGSGKTVAAVQMSEIFEGGLTIISCHGEMTVYDLTGFTDGNGNYKHTEFFKAWRDGNIILMDEVDKAPGEVNVLLNAALAQGTITFPVGTLKKKDTTKLLFTGNTKMSGADAIYSAGQRQDASFSNRMISIEWPFDKKLERILAETESERFGGTPDQGRNCHTTILRIRELVEELGMNYVVGQRQSMMLAAAVAKGRDEKVAIEEVVYAWMDSNDASRIREKVAS